MFETLRFVEPSPFIDDCLYLYHLFRRTPAKLAFRLYPAGVSRRWGGASASPPP